MTSIAVVAHQNKSFGGGLTELRKVLSDRGFPDPIWYEARKSREAPGLVRQVIADGAEILFVWGGDGTVQRCVDAVAGHQICLAILPAGTANLLARNLQIPIDLGAAVDIGLHGARRRLDVGVLNDKRFAVMAGVGFDAVMMQGANRKRKDRLGRLAYVWAGARATRMSPFKVRIAIDEKRWFKGKATCILLGQMGALIGDLVVFPNARPDDGLLEVGVVTAESTFEWARVLSRLVIGHADRSPLVQMTRGREVDIKLDRRAIYELDGGAKKARKKLRATVEPGAIIVCVPERGYR